MYSNKSSDTVKWTVFMQDTPKIQPITSEPELSHIQKACQEMCGWEHVGFPGHQPVSMDNKNLKYLQQNQYKVSWKPESVRYLMLIDGKYKVYLIDSDNCVFKVSNILFPKRKSPNKHICQTLLDGEMVMDEVEGKVVPNYLIHDIIKFEQHYVGKTNFDTRMICIQKEIIEPRRIGKEKGLISKNSEPFGIRNKDFWDIITTKKLLSEKFIKSLTHNVNGLIFQPIDMSYYGGRNIEVLAWEKPNLSYIDFKLILKSDDSNGDLCVGASNRVFGKIKITKELEHLDKKVIQCKFEDNEWKCVLVKDGKLNPDSYLAALSIWNGIRAPVVEKTLLEFIDQFRWKPNAVRKTSPVDNCSPTSKRRKKL